MGKVSLLDCTLRDGGYLNNWAFGEKAIDDMVHQLENTNVEMLELGFIRNEPDNKDRTVFSSPATAMRIVGKKKEGLLYSVMGELSSEIPLENIPHAEESGIDIIRMIIWKDKTLPDGRVVDALEEGYRYCKGLVEKGYKVCVQPVRVNQYSEAEFVAMVRHFSKLNPMAIYVVDSWGTDNPEDLLHYMHLADENLPKGISIGYHGHNNMMHAMAVAQAILRENFERDIIIDASVYGIGRGAGNLNLELIAKYMNEQYGKAYDLTPMLHVYNNYIQDIYAQEAWGYSIPFLITAMHKANPRCTTYMVHELHLDNDAISYVLDHLPQKYKIIFDKKQIDAVLETYGKKKAE